MDESLNPETVSGRLRQKMVDRGELVMSQEELDIYRSMPAAGSNDDRGERVDMLFEFQKRCGMYPEYSPGSRLAVMEKFEKIFEKGKK